MQLDDYEAVLEQAQKQYDLAIKVFENNPEIFKDSSEEAKAAARDAL